MHPISPLQFGTQVTVDQCVLNHKKTVNHHLNPLDTLAQNLQGETGGAQDNSGYALIDIHNSHFGITYFPKGKQKIFHKVGNNPDTLLDPKNYQGMLDFINTNKPTR